MEQLYHEWNYIHIHLIATSTEHYSSTEWIAKIPLYPSPALILSIQRTQFSSGLPNSTSKCNFIKLHLINSILTPDRAVAHTYLTMSLPFIGFHLLQFASALCTGRPPSTAGLCILQMETDSKAILLVRIYVAGRVSRDFVVCHYDLGFWPCLQLDGFRTIYNEKCLIMLFLYTTVFMLYSLAGVG